jgi:tetratricopeptide (TPR) repeat protein
MGLCYGKMALSDKEIRAYKRALAIKPEMVPALANLGNAYFGRDRYADAMRQYDKALLLRPDDHNILYNLAACYANTDRFEQAADLYGRVLDLSPEMVETHAQLAFVFYKLGRYEQADEQIRSADLSGVQVDENLRRAIEKRTKE